MSGDSDSYRQRKQFYAGMLTVYGRKPVLEVLQDESLPCHRLHLADSNKTTGIINDMITIAQRRGIEVLHHSRAALSRISRNGKQDQGVAADIRCPGFAAFEQQMATLAKRPTARLLALDGIGNPQNLGMIIRSACAGNIDGIVIAARGNAALGPLVIKASAGTVYRAPILSCDDLAASLGRARAGGWSICTLNAAAEQSLFDYRQSRPTIYVLGNETEGVSREVGQLSDQDLSIPMRNGVESLNVAVTAALIAFNGA